MHAPLDSQLETMASGGATKPPLVSVILTTCQRPTLVGAAIKSVLSQSWGTLELLVIVDGLDSATEAVLEKIDDPRLRIHVQPRRAGQAAACNRGVLLATGDWCAFLDDDDIWLPHKLAVQMKTMLCSRDPVVMSCWFLARSEYGTQLWPLRAPARDESVADYLFCRHRLAFGEGIAPTSTLLASRRLLLQYPMSEDLQHHTDLDWLLRVGEAGASLRFPRPREPLALWNNESQRTRMSTGSNWRWSLSWIRGKRNGISPRAYGDFLLTWLTPVVRASGAWWCLPGIAIEATQRGRPGPQAAVVFLAICLLPTKLRHRLSRSLSRCTPAVPR